MIETREVIIYEIPNVKVGSTYDIKKRMRAQGNPDYRVVQVIEPNTLTVRECWEQEQDWAIRLGYEPEHEGHWLFVETFRGKKNLWNDLEYREMMVQYAKERWKDPEYRKMMTEKAKRQGKQSINFQGAIINEKGERFEGKKQLEEAGYHPGNVYACINGKRKTHKGLSWWREPL